MSIGRLNGMQINTCELHLEQIPPQEYLNSGEIVVNRGVGIYGSLNSGCSHKELGHVSKVLDGKWVGQQREVK